MNTTNPPIAGGRRKAWRAGVSQCNKTGVVMRFILAALLVFAATACKHNKQASTTVRNRAAFDLSCPKEDLTLVVADTDGARKLATQIAVYGCGDKAVYA